MIEQVKSPLEKAEKLSQKCGNSLFLKREDVQPVRLHEGEAVLVIDFKILDADYSIGSQGHIV